MTDPRMTTTDAPVTVEQIAARLIDQSDEPDWTGGNYSERMNYWRDKAIDCSNRLAALASEPAGDRVEEALAWYGEQTRLCRKIGRDGDAARRALDADGGKRAAAALARPRAAVGDWRLVPIDPTPAMIQAGLKVDHEHLSKHGQASPLTPVWSAMISAAPAVAPAGDGERNSALRQAAQEAYRVCAETRHITLGDKVRDAILALQSPPAKVDV